MAVYELCVSELSDYIEKLRCGDKVFLTGDIYTARDAAHSIISKMIVNEEELPFVIDGSVIYYAGPTPVNAYGHIGSYGPTTSARMDNFTPLLLDNGVIATIGKGNRSDNVIDAIKRNKSVYFCACGGLGALISETIIKSEEIAFSELGCESIKRLTVNKMPLITAIDSSGKSIFDRF